jgi:[protein-PII] uridylyltransferase
MAAKSYLSRKQFQEADGVIQPPLSAPTGNESEASQLYSLQFSKWLAEKLHARLSAHPDWQSAGPVALGSWARGELCPKSDVDLLFCGNEDAVKRLVGDFAKQGVKLRYRMPEDPHDWTKGVLPFDILALFAAVPYTAAAEVELSIQKSALNNQAFRKSLLRAMTLERKSRTERYDSIANFLEPNLKFGPGALRDLEQALTTIELFPDQYNRVSHESRHAREVLLYYKRFFLLVRQRLHLSEGGGDVLAAPEQRLISEWLGYTDTKEFMREIQKGLTRVSFYADWVIAQAVASKAKLAEVEARPLKTVRQLFEALEEDPSVMMQSRVRNSADEVFAKVAQLKDRTVERLIGRLIGRKLSEFISPNGNERTLVALIRSRLIDHCVNDFRRIVGQVQHDQYHRFSVDAHITQALRELSRMRARPSLAGRMKALVKSLSDQDWQILAFSCLYHDIAKGRVGHHAELGVAVAQTDMERFGKSETFVREVSWIVEQHLILSSAAFRENSRSPRTWQKLAEKGAVGRRLTRLAVFTIVDIRATNPDAWTPWKERLLAELVEQLTRPEASLFLDFSTRIKKDFFLISGPSGRDLAERLSETLDPFLISSLPRSALIADFKAVYEASGASATATGGSSLAPLVVQVRSGAQTWIRFHSPVDRAGLFLEFVTQLTQSGLPVRHASIQTSSDLGVYDWFEVKTKRPASEVRRLLAASAKITPTLRPAHFAKVRFDSIELVSTSDKDWVISFRGKDQAGALSEAVRVLFEEGLTIHWAKVHTWGRQIDDVFSVSRDERSVGDLLKKLHSELAFSEEIIRLGIVDKKVKL